MGLSQNSGITDGRKNGCWEIQSDVKEQKFEYNNIGDSSIKIADYVENQIKGLWGTDFDENGISVIKTNNLTYEGYINYSDICKRNITEEEVNGCYLKSGDLLIEKSGGAKTHSVGYVSYFEGEENKFVCNNFILALRPKNIINSKFLFYQINSMIALIKRLEFKI